MLRSAISARRSTAAPRFEMRSECTRMRREHALIRPIIRIGPWRPYQGERARVCADAPTPCSNDSHHFPLVLPARRRSSRPSSARGCRERRGHAPPYSTATRRKDSSGALGRRPQPRAGGSIRGPLAPPRAPRFSRGETLPILQRRMRVCLVVHGFPPVERTGVENYTSAWHARWRAPDLPRPVFVPRKTAARRYRPCSAAAATPSTGSVASRSRQPARGRCASSAGAFATRRRRPGSCTST